MFIVYCWFWRRSYHVKVVLLSLPLGQNGAKINWSKEQYWKTNNKEWSDEKREGKRTSLDIDIFEGVQTAYKEKIAEPKMIIYWVSIILIQSVLFHLLHPFACYFIRTLYFLNRLRVLYWLSNLFLHFFTFILLFWGDWYWLRILMYLRNCTIFGLFNWLRYNDYGLYSSAFFFSVFFHLHFFRFWA